EGGLEASAIITVNRRPIGVTGIIVDPITSEIYDDETIQLTGTVSPSDADNPTVSWESSDSGIATVDGNGLVTAIAEGIATITVRTNEGGLEASAIITVNRRPIGVTGIIVDPTDVILAKGETVSLIATVSPTDADDQSVTWSSSDDGIATVDSNGLVTAVLEGTAKISVTSTDGNYEATSTITVENEDLIVNIDNQILILSVDLAPNPIRILKKATISLNASRNSEAMVRLFNMIGQLLSEKKHAIFKGDNQMVLETDKLPSGVYFITVEAEGISHVKQLIIK
uniref:Ig-like domain-containing protein n=1 Tax=uncultured Croceitalea sp. TaxID=1798908 RepID=UPI0033058E41